MAINLKKRPSAYAEGGAARLVAEFSRSGRGHVFHVGSSAHSGRPRLKHGDACDFRQGSWKIICPFSNRSAGRSGFASSLDQKLSVVRIGEKLNLVNSVRHAACTSHLPEKSDGTINQR